MTAEILDKQSKAPFNLEDFLREVKATAPLVRTLGDLMPVLYAPESVGSLSSSLPLYYVHWDVARDNDRPSLMEKGLRYDVTVMPPLVLGEEYVKTIGHDNLPYTTAGHIKEIFEVLEGEARFLVQEYRGEEVVNVSLVTAGQGSVFFAPENYGVVMINPSIRRLVVRSLSSRNLIHTYTRFIGLGGGAYFLLTHARAVKNKNYGVVPELRIVSAETLQSVERESGLLKSVVRNPERFMFLKRPGPEAKLEGFSDEYMH